MRSAKVALAIAMSVALYGCGDPGFSSLVINDSSEVVLVRYQPKESGLGAVVVRVDGSGRGIGLGGIDWASWQGSRIDVMGTDCRLLGTVSLESTDTSVLVSASLVVSRLLGPDTPASSGLELPRVPDCQAGPVGAG